MALLTCGAASAQPAGAVATGPGGIAARSIAGVAILDLRIIKAATERDYRIAAAMLEVASELAPEDEHILRLLIDATSAAGDQERLLAQNKRLVKLNPADTVAQLRLISGMINSLQEADTRLAVYERYVGAEGESKGIDPSVRSRLALDEALLLRERGDLDGFADKLSRALALDATNKDAAALAVTFYTEMKQDASGRLTLLLNLLLADPLDVETHLAIARELAAGGEYAGAGRFYDLIARLYSAARQNVPAGIFAEAQTVAWNLNGAEKLISTFRSEVERGRADLEESRRRAIAAQQPTDKIPAPEELRLTIELERVRAAAAAASGDDAQLGFAFNELERTFQSQIDARRDPKVRPAGYSAEDAAKDTAQLEAELLWMRLWCGRNVEDAAKMLERLKADPDVNQDALARMSGWLLLRQGDLDGAQKVLEPLAADDPLAAMGLGLVQEKRGRLPGAAEKYTQISQSYAGTLAGAWARTRVIALTGQPPPPPAEAAALREQVAGIPNWIDDMVANPRQLGALQASVEEQRITPLRSAVVRVKLTNLAPIPMGIGPDRPLSTRVLLAPSVTLGVDPVAAAAAATVARLDQRLRLLPQESVEVPVWADAAMLSRFLDDLCGLPAQIRWRVLQGFLVTAEGYFQEGPLSLTTNTPMLMRSKSPRALDDGKTLVRWLESGSAEDLADCLQGLRWKLQIKEGVPGVLTAEDKTQIDAVIAKRYRAADRLVRLMILALLPPGKQCGWMTEFNKAAAEEKDPSVMLAVLITRVFEAASPILGTAMASEDRRLAETAGLMKARLEAGILGFAAIPEPIGASAKAGQATIGQPSPGADAPGKPVQPGTPSSSAPPEGTPGRPPR